MVNVKDNSLLTMSDVNVGFCSASSTIRVLENVNLTIKKERRSGWLAKAARVRR